MAKAILIVMYIAGGSLTGEHHDIEMQDFGSMEQCELIAKKLSKSNKLDAYCVPYE